MIKSNIFLFPEYIVYKQVIAKLSLFLNLILDKRKNIAIVQFYDFKFEPV